MSELFDEYVRLREDTDLTVRSIADLMGITHGAAAGYQHRAKLKDAAQPKLKKGYIKVMRTPNLYAASNEELIAELCLRMDVGGQKPDFQPLYHQMDKEKDQERTRALARREARNTPWPPPLVGPADPRGEHSVGRVVYNGWV